MITLLAQAATPAVDEELADVVERFDAMGQTAVDALPRMGIALVVLVVMWLLGSLLGRLLEPRLSKLSTPSFGRVAATLAAGATKILALLTAVTIVFPSVDVSTIFASFGVVGIAAGFAFQDILSNLLSGILLIFRQPFVAGDQIEVTGIAGTVEGITIRETRLTTYDGRLVVIPNKDVYVNAITVQTHHDLVRSSFVTGVGYDSDLDQVRDLTLATIAAVDGVVADPPPEAYFVEHATSAVSLDVRYWTGSRQAEIRRVQDRVVQALYDAYHDAGIDMPFDVVTLDSGDRFREAMERTGARRDDAA